MSTRFPIWDTTGRDTFNAKQRVRVIITLRMHLYGQGEEKSSSGPSAPKEDVHHLLQQEGGEVLVSEERRSRPQGILSI